MRAFDIALKPEPKTVSERSLTKLYKPNFCAECGTRIERARWRLWTSGKFCDACAKLFRRATVLKSLALVLAILGGGFFIGRAGRQTAPPLIVARNDATLQTVRPNGANASNVAAQTSLQTSTSLAQNESSTNSPLKKMRDGKFAETPLDANELVSICGARTLKGTPCSRRVRGTGHRCWQHIGKTAMLPPEKLVVQGKLP